MVPLLNHQAALPEIRQLPGADRPEQPRADNQIIIHAFSSVCFISSLIKNLTDSENRISIQCRQK
jgi:hypothetical protein